MRIRTHRETVRWASSLDQTLPVTHHLLGENLRKRQGLALLLPLGQLGLKLFHQMRIDQGQPRDTSMAVLRVEMAVPAVREILEVGRNCPC